jgi:hypothetical protein
MSGTGVIKPTKGYLVIMTQKYAHLAADDLRRASAGVSDMLNFAA